MKNRIITLILAAGLLGAAVHLSAKPGFGGGQMDPMDHIERMAEHLDLSAEQEQQITEIVNAAEIATAVDRERLQQLREEFRNLAANFDEGRAQGLADELGQTSGRLAYSHASTMASVRGVLTAEQLQQLEGIRSRRGEHFRQFGGSRRGMYGGQ
jgi:Spy/CpxP family protein refolding chaperone